MRKFRLPHWAWIVLPLAMIPGAIGIDWGLWSSRQHAAISRFNRADAYSYVGTRTDTPEWLRRAVPMGWSELVNAPFVSVVVLQIDELPVNDEDLRYIAGLTHLQVLTLGEQAEITDAGLVHLSGLSQLRTLNLHRTPITDDGLFHLRRLNELEELVLDETAVTDAGLQHLRHLPRLKRLSVESTMISNAAIARLLQ